MKVLFVGEDLHKSRSGVVTVMNQILNDDTLKRDYEFIKVFTTSDDYSTPKKLLGWLKAYLKFLYYLPFCDLVHIHHASDMNFWLSSGMVSLTRLLNKKVLLHNHSADFHEFYDKTSEKNKRKIERTFTRASGTIVLSNHWLSWYSAIAPQAKWFMLQNAIEIPLHVEPKTIAGDIMIIYLARIEKRKGFYDLINVMKPVIDKYPQVVLNVAGQGDLDLAQAQINDRGLGKNVKLLGYIDSTERDKYLHLAHILAFPSYNEGLPMSLLEAMSYGLVPITTPVGGIPDVVKSGENGLIVNPGDLNALEYAISALIDSPDRYTSMSAQAKSTIQKDFNYLNYGAKLKAIYQLL